MKYRLSGLVVVFIAVGCICVALISPELSAAAKWALWIAAAVLVLVGGAMLKKESEKTPQQIQEKEVLPARYAKKDSLVTPPEQALMDLLRRLFGDRFEILPQIALVSLVEKLNYTSYRNELFRVVDFVITDAGFYPLVVIELNDRSHLRADRAERDRKVADILQKAGIPLVVLSPEEAADASYVRRSVGRYLR